MAIEFRDVELRPLHHLTATAPDGAVIGLIGEKGAGKGALLKLAAGLATPSSGCVRFEGTRRYLGPSDSLQLSPVNLLLLEHTFAQHDALVRARAMVGIDRLRGDGTTVLVVSHEADLQRRISDEIWWLDGGALARRGNPAEVLEAYQAHIAAKFRACGETLSSPIQPALRRGDSRAEIVALETLGANGRASMVWQSGEEVTIRVTVRYREAVEKPVIGILIRTRIGLEVYGTNTELERIEIGPCAPGECIAVHYRFRCELCPGEYTLTAASHDPDGTAHDWLEDAVALVVTDSRDTAGVANLHAKAAVQRL